MVAYIPLQAPAHLLGCAVVLVTAADAWLEPVTSCVVLIQLALWCARWSQPPTHSRGIVGLHVGGARHRCSTTHSSPGIMHRRRFIRHESGMHVHECRPLACRKLWGAGAQAVEPSTSEALTSRCFV